MTTELAAIVAKIHKLLAISEDRGASENEAALAASHVQRLLAEHNLSMATVEAAGGSSGSAGQRKRGTVERKQVYRWQRELMETLAKLNYCHLTLRWKLTNSTSRAFDGYELVGRASNVATVEHLFDYLLAAIERLARDHVGDPALYFTRPAHSFKEGCSDRLRDRLEDRAHELREEAQRRSEEAAAQGGGRALITLDDVRQTELDLNNDYFEGWEPGTTATNRARDAAKSAEAAARRAAKLAEYKAQGVPHNVADYMSWGYSRSRAEELCEEPKPAKPETEAQRLKREAKERRQNERYWQRRAAAQARERKRLDRTAYAAGQQAGETVGLDPQLKRDAKPVRPALGR